MCQPPRQGLTLGVRIAWGSTCASTRKVARLTTYGGSASARDGRPCRNAHGVDWLSDSVAVDRRLGSTATTAQVHPGQFTAAMMRAAEAQGAELRLGRVTGLVRDAARVRGVEVDGGIIEGDAVVIAMGPWSILAAGWLPLPAVLGLKGHSLVFETGTKVPAEALFLEYQEAGGGMHSPEVFPRTDGTTYVCAIWGILNAPATGEAMAELIADGAARTVDLAPFDPARLPPLDPRRLRTEAGTRL